METSLIVEQIFSNVAADKALIVEAQGFVDKLISGFITLNAELIVSIADEAQFFAVLDGVLSKAIPDSYIEGKIDAVLPFWAKPLEGIEHSYEEKYRAQFQLVVLNFIKTQLEKILGLDWFTKIQAQAKAVISATSK